MKIKMLSALLILGVIISGFTPNETLVDGFSYQLEVRSLTGKKESFTVKIVSIPHGKTESKEITLQNVQTPFEKILGEGKHTITIETNSDKKTIIGTVVTLVDGKKQRGASSSNEQTKNIELFAGPNGKCSASQ